MKSATAKWTGISPLVIQKYTQPVTNRPVKKAEEPLPVEKLWLVEGTIQMPSINVLMCIRDGAGRVIEKNRTTYKSTILGLLQIQDALYIPVRSKSGKDYTAESFTDWTDPKGLWARPIKRSTGDRIFVTSPMLSDWAVEFSFLYDNNVLQASTVKEIQDVAGRMFGFGCARQLGFGRFTVEIK